MNIFELAGRIVIDNKNALSQIGKTTKEATNIGKAFTQAQATSGKSLNQIAAANGKTVNQIRSEVAKAAAEYKKQGLSASEAMKKAYADIGYKAEETHEKINDETEKTGEHYSKLGDVITKLGTGFGKIGNKAIACGKVVAKGLTVVAAAGAAAATTLFKGSIENYAEYEQLVGGVETLFKDSSGKVMGYAKNAYKTAGLSANDYMSTVTSFSASLLQGLGGDTAAAAEMANMAVTDMADNANKMGTDISMIQNAYQGFAKQNYTMLDNLKLGYGGTQAEMARLINDSGVMGDSFVATAENVNSISFAKIIEAIHVIQNEMGITGTTAKEASDTIEGSFNSWKATWTNLLTGMADDENIEPLVDAFFDAGQNMLKNIGNVLPKIGKNIVNTLKLAGQRIRTTWAQNIWPSIQQYAKVNLGIDLPEWSDIETKVTTWWSGVKSGFQTVCTWTMNLFSNPGETAEEISAAVFGWWTNTALPAIKSVSTWALNLFGMPEATDDTITAYVAAWWKGAGNLVVDACSWSLQLFGVPKESADAAASRVKTWWSGAIGAVENACQWTLKFFGLAPWTDEDSKKVVAWWESVASFFTNAINFVIYPDMQKAANFASYVTGTWFPEFLRSVGSLVIPIATTITRPFAYGLGSRTGLSEEEVDAGLDAINETAQDPQTALDKIGNTDQSAFQKLFRFMFTGDQNTYSDKGAVAPRFATGLDFVPYNEFPARLHYGEAVLTREDASAWRTGRAEDVATLANRLDSALDRLASIMQQVAANTAAGHSIALDSGVLVGQLAPRLDAQLGTLTARKERRG